VDYTVVSLKATVLSLICIEMKTRKLAAEIHGIIATPSNARTSIGAAESLIPGSELQVERRVR
jgi:hypothetical protein